MSTSDLKRKSCVLKWTDTKGIISEEDGHQILFLLLGVYSAYALIVKKKN